MKVFLSWSGEPSHRVALLLHKKLPLFIQALKPWISTEDIARGTLWREALGRELEDGSVGIFCVTRANVTSPWVNFEAGALSKTLEESRVIPFLFDMRPSDVAGPLADLQAAIFQRNSPKKNQNEFRKLLAALNTARTPPLVSETVLDHIFMQIWPDLVQQLDQIAVDAAQISDDPAKEPDPAAVLEEVLQAVRDQSRMLGRALGDERWTFRGNARLDPLSTGDYRELALGLGMLKTLAEIDVGDYQHPTGAIVNTLLKLRDPLEVLLARARAPRIHSVYFREVPDGPWPVTFTEDRVIEEESLHQLETEASSEISEDDI